MYQYDLDPEQRVQAMVVWAIILAVLPVLTECVLLWVLTEMHVNVWLLMAGVALCSTFIVVVCMKLGEQIAKRRYGF